MAEQMSFELANQTVKHYVCARCWSRLLVTFHDGSYWVECSNAAHCDGKGYVTKGYAERQVEQSYYDLRDARQNIGFILPARDPMDAEREARIFAELGF